MYLLNHLTAPVPTVRNVEEDDQVAKGNIMDLHFERPSEAYAAVAWAICAADEEGTVEERAHLHDHVSKMEVFKDLTHADFTALLGSTRTRLFANLPNNGICIAPAGIDQIIKSVNSVLDREQRLEAYRMARGIAEADKLMPIEVTVLEQLADGFGIAREVENMVPN